MFLEFLLDTLNFINGSERKSFYICLEKLLLTEPGTKNYVEINNRRINKLRDLFPKIPLTTAQVIKNWCSQENGFEDLIISLFIFFHSSPNLNNKAIQQLKLL